MTPDLPQGLGALSPLIPSLEENTPDLAGAVLPVLPGLGAGLGAITGAVAGSLGAGPGAVIGARAGAELGTGSSGLPVLESTVQPKAFVGELAQAPGPQGPTPGMLEQLYQLHQPAPLPVHETAPLVTTGPMPPYWFMLMLAVLVVIWAAGVFASRVLVPAATEEPEPAQDRDRDLQALLDEIPPHEAGLTFRLVFSAGMALWVFILTLGTLLSTEIAGVQFWLFYMPVMSAMIGCMFWCGLAALESYHRGRVLRYATGIEQEGEEPRDDD